VAAYSWKTACSAYGIALTEATWKRSGFDQPLLEAVGAEAHSESAQSKSTD